MRKLILPVVAITLIVGLGATREHSLEDRSASFVAPRIIMVHSELLEEPLYMTDWSQNLELLGAIRAGTKTEVGSLADRPRIHFTLFMDGPRWEPYANDPELLRTLTPAMAKTDPHSGASEWCCTATLYPALGGAQPLFDSRPISKVQGGLYTVSPKLRAVLAAVGVPLEAG